MGFLRKLFGQEKIEPLITALNKDSDQKERERAIATLTKIGARAVEPLIAALKDSKARDGATEALGKIGAPAITLLIATLTDTTYGVQTSAATALRTIGSPALQSLTAALLADDEKVRGGAAYALGVMGDAHAIEPLIAALHNGDKGVWREASEALVKFGAPAVDPLIAALGSDNNWRCKMAANILGDIGDVRAVEPLLAALKDSNLSGNAVIALGKLGDARAVEPLIAALQDSQRVKETATALGKLGDARAVEPLIVVLKDKNVAKGYTGEILTEVLGKFGDARIVEPFADVITDNTGEITDTQKKHAARALADMNPAVVERRQAIAPLIVWLTKFGTRFGSAVGKPHDSLQALNKIDPAWPTSEEARNAAPLLAEIIKKETRSPGYQPPSYESSWRQHAIELLVITHAPIVEALVSAIACWDGQVRNLAEEVLDKYYPEWPQSEAAIEAIPFLIAAFGPESGTQNRGAVNFEGIRAKNALARIGPPAVKPLMLAMKNKDPRVREYAAITLGEIGDASAVETLRNALKDDDEKVRFSAQSALEELEK